MAVTYDFVAADWTITRSTGNIRYTGDDHGVGNESYATVIQFHRALQAFADDASSAGDDQLDITDENPSARSTDNIITLLGNYNITNVESEHLYDGSIIQGGGDDIWDGFVNFGNSDVQIQIVQNGAILTDDWWNQGGIGLNADDAQGISHRFMLPVRASGSDIDGRRLVGISRTFGNTYAEFNINGTSRGNNVFALSDASDLNNQTAAGTVATWTTIDNSTEGYVGLDINNDAADEYYYSEWNKATYTINQFYERMKWLTRDGSAETLYGLSGELFRGITHEITVDGGSGTWGTPEHEELTWGTGATAGTGQVLAVNDKTGTSTTKIWIQLLSGVIPTDGMTMTGTTSGATADMNVTITSRTISKPFVGQSTGSALIGSYGLGVESTDLTNADTVFNLSNVAVNPPNYVTFTVGGLVNTEDRVLVAPWDGVSTDAEGNPAIDVDQLALNTTLSGAAETAVVVTAAIPADTPNTGWIRVELDTGFYRLVPYTSWTGSTFTIASSDWTDPDDATAGNNVWIAYIDKTATGASAAFTGVYTADRDLVVIVRDGAGTPIKQFISSSSLTSAGGSVTAIRTSDT